ncbi:alpha/beta hydrolase [Aequorivita marina]|uniref:alpha/beta hydrolase n=1 Tax=Aequorivita marina TaxID=3073654 RepID=UPI002875D5DA|nr:alpha/beta hydrolase [Aequorivita sp. S2608]MDS1299226.1 alpha/beta hydrolase [Aequorivita sp. S2608]
MKKLLLPFLIIAIQFGLTSCSKDTDSVIEETVTEAETFLDVSYGAHPAETYDLYLPKNRATDKTKVIALVHGGGWTTGDKDDVALYIPYLQQKHPDYAIVNINYVLADENTPAFPNQILNIAAVLDKLTDEKKELQILPEFALIGVSAGAHLSLLYDYVYDADDHVKLVADIVGPTDFTDPNYTPSTDLPTLIALMVDESAYPPGTNYVEVLSPALQVSTVSSPSLLFYGNADPLVPLSNAITLNEALNTHEIDHNFNVYEGGHANWATNDVDDMLNQISDYINRYLEIEK